MTDKIKFKVILKSPTFMGNYWGNNHEAGTELRNKHTPPRNILYINTDLTPAERRKVVVHEKVEEYLMRAKHMHYAKAHKIANAFENNVHTKGYKTKEVKDFEKKYNY